MSHEQHLPTAAESQQMSAGLNTFEEVRNLPETLIHSVGQDPTPYDMPKMGEGAMNRKEGVFQDLHGFVKAGNETFAVISSHVLEDKDDIRGNVFDSFLLARLPAAEGERATVVGFFDTGAPLTVGRNHQEGLDTLTSREHFKIGLNEGKLVVADLGSKNGTEVVLGNKNAAKDRSHTNPLNDLQKWSPKSADLRKAVEDQRGVTSAEPTIISEVPKFDKPIEAPAPVVEQQKTVDEALDELKARFNDEDQLNLWRYSTALMRKTDAQKAGDGRESSLQGQYAGEALKDMSPAAKEAADQYHRLFRSR